MTASFHPSRVWRSHVQHDIARGSLRSLLRLKHVENAAERDMDYIEDLGEQNGE